MGNRTPSGSGAWNSITGLLAFVLSAVLAVGFVAVVNKTHDLFAGAECEQQKVPGNHQENWPYVPSIQRVLQTLRRPT